MKMKTKIKTMTKMKIKRPSERKRGGGVANTSPRSAQTRGKQREFDWRIFVSGDLWTCVSHFHDHASEKPFEN